MTSSAKQGLPSLDDQTEAIRRAVRAGLAAGARDEVLVAAGRTLAWLARNEAWIKAEAARREAVARKTAEATALVREHFPGARLVGSDEGDEGDESDESDGGVSQ